MEATKEKRATFTPGPWEKATIGIGTNLKQVVWLGEKTGRRIQVIGTGRDHANARLIAAAPAMYEALKNLVADWERCIGAIPHDHEAREVLAKVEGGEG
jgi:hypothetical protein